MLRWGLFVSARCIAMAERTAKTRYLRFNRDFPATSERIF
jgi:hypothetical protein